MGKSKKAWIITGITAVIVAISVIAAVFLFPKGQAEGQYVARSQAFRFESESVYAVFASEDGTYEMSIEGDNPTDVSLLVNGLPINEDTADGTAQVSLHKGINSISLIDESDGITGIRVKGCPNYPEYGALVNYTSYEAEDCETNATVSEESRDYRVFASEASGRRYVALENEGDYVTVKLTAPADALVIRFCVPDSENGAGLTGTVDLLVNGEQQGLTLTSKHSWVYGVFPWNNDPSTANEGGPHMFFDDVRVKLERVYPERTEITIRKGEMFEYCLIDLIEAEQIPSPIAMPQNALSVVDFGAIPDDGEDDSWAIMECIAAATEQGKEVYIPAGEFEIKDHPYAQGIPLRKNNITIRGAGMWHTVLRGQWAGFLIEAANVHLYDFSLIGDVDQRRDSIDPSAICLETPKAGVGNIRLQNIWIEHYKVGMWADVVNGISVMGCRFRNTYADGINLCAGTSRCVLTHNDFRNTGDDAIAMFNRGVLEEDNKVIYNTVSLPWLANNIALYGGKNIEISHNLLKDTICFGSGVNISTNFTPQVFEGTILVENNYLLRCGSRENNINVDYGAVWVNTVAGYDNTADCIVRNNVIENSTYQAVSFFNGGLVENMQITDNTITGCGTFAFGIGPETRGSVTIKDNAVTDATTGEMENLSNGAFVVLG